MSLRKQILDKVIEAVNQEFENAEIYLFGSQATGSADLNSSDWDLLILLDILELSFELETHLMNKFYEIELDTNQVISPLVYSKFDWNETRSLTPLYSNIKKEAIRVQ